MGNRANKNQSNWGGFFKPLALFALMGPVIPLPMIAIWLCIEDMSLEPMMLMAFGFPFAYVIGLIPALLGGITYQSCIALLGSAFVTRRLSIACAFISSLLIGLAPLLWGVDISELLYFTLCCVLSGLVCGYIAPLKY